MHAHPQSHPSLHPLPCTHPYNTQPLPHPLYTYLKPRRARLVYVGAFHELAGHVPVGAGTRGALVQLPLLPVAPRHAVDGAVLRLAAVLLLNAHRAALSLGGHLVLARAVQHGAGGTLAGDVVLVAGTGGAVVQVPLHARGVEEPVEEAALPRRRDELP